MDSEHRHELKENDLRQFLANFGEWRRKHGGTTLLWVLLIVLVLVGWNLFSSARRSAHDNAWDDLAGATSPATYPLIAEEHDDQTVKALASLWGGDALLAESLSPDAPAQSMVDPLARAEGLYNQVLSLTQEPLYRANALLGLASVAESRGDYEKAADFYDRAIAEAEPNYAAVALRAAQRKALLDRLAEPVVFGKTSLLPSAAAQEEPAPPTE